MKKQGTKKKKGKKLRNYIFVVLCSILLLSMVANDFGDFFQGFFAGWHEMDISVAEEQFGDLSRIIGIITLGVLAAFFYYVVRDLEKEARKIREQQEERNRQLYAGIAHDLKTPMTMIKGYAKVLEEKESLTKEEQKRYLQVIVEQTEQANQLLDTMLTYVKLESQAYSLQLEKKDIAECLRTCVASFYPTMEAAGLQLQLEIPEQKIEYLFDESQMKRVFLNLLSNMVKHNPVGTVGLIRLSCESGLQIIIADNGPKIPKELQAKLFESFAVGDASRNTRNGNGLGLAICKKIVEKHGGNIAYQDSLLGEYKGFVMQYK